jgi:protein gp37
MNECRSGPIWDLSSNRVSGREPPTPEDWYDVTWNPTIGCSARSPGCDHCDALRAAIQLARMGGRTGAHYAGLARLDAAGPVWSGEIRVREDLLTWPLLRANPRRILVGTMSDVFHENLDTVILDRLHAVMVIAHWHQFLLFSKRSERMAAYGRDPETPRRVARELETLSAALLPRPAQRAIAGKGSVIRRRWGSALSRARERLLSGNAWPLPNLWLGVSVEDEARLMRVCHLLQTPAARRWICFEPLLGPVRPDAIPVGDAYVDALRGHRYRLDGRGREIAVEAPAWPPVDWVMVGGEYGAAARPMHPDWARGVRDRCAAAGVPFFFKQWGEWAPSAGNGAERAMIRIGRRAAGRLLDGRSWNEIPPSLMAR